MRIFHAHFLAIYFGPHFAKFKIDLIPRFLAAGKNSNGKTVVVPLISEFFRYPPEES